MRFFLPKNASVRMPAARSSFAMRNTSCAGTLPRLTTSACTVDFTGAIAPRCVNAAINRSSPTDIPVAGISRSRNRPTRPLYRPPPITLPNCGAAGITHSNTGPV